MDKEKIQAAVVAIIEALGEDPTRPGLAETPRRIADMYEEVFGGITVDPLEVLGTVFEEGPQEMIVCKDIPFFSMCEHHLLPFHGKAHVGYIPGERVLGLSKLARVVDILARRPQMQERLTGQIADTLQCGLNPRGVAVVIEAEHLCMTMRGIKKPGTLVVTSATRGIFRRNVATRAEFFSLVQER